MDIIPIGSIASIVRERLIHAVLDAFAQEPPVDRTSGSLRFPAFSLRQ